MAGISRHDHARAQCIVMLARCGDCIARILLRREWAQKQRGPVTRTPSCVGEPTLLLLLRCLLGGLLGTFLRSFLRRFLCSFLSHGEMGLMPNLASFDHVYATCAVNVAHHQLLKSLKR